ncbi:hypothetical protein FKG94_22690 [Exilibacterium tricleocarpae]|uniref:Uncharacterized protein n=1 Tax=Exilibacterium tricleocarpae TaxID=2591008 RepID=A0A545SXB3_9GAMM|nr:hypothetical protein [Exilibacterium tricleocarpae]TQV69605.1 hypothetical protein FKG94_22690 [Exilibacterium tricleocarpae]
MHRVIQIAIMLSLSISCFFGGMYVGLGQGALYALGLEAHGARYRIFSYERGEFQEGESKEAAEATIDSNISYFGQHLENHWLLHQVPSPWSLSESGVSFMKTAVEYRIKNPRKNDAKLLSIMGQEPTEQYLEDRMNLIREENGELYLSEEETIEVIKESLLYMKTQEAFYQRALEYVKQLNEGGL